MVNDNQLRWQAADAEDLVLVSSAIQDGIVQVGDIEFDKLGRFFTLLFNRFRWEAKDYGKGQRVASALRIDGVLSVKSREISRANPKAIAVLLAIEFTPDKEPPGGIITLTFAGGGEVCLTVECIDLILVDVSPSRGSRKRPDHDLETAS